MNDDEGDARGLRYLGEMLGPLRAGFGRRMQRKAEEDESPTLGGELSFAAAVDVIRSPKDFPPAKSGSSGARERAGPTPFATGRAATAAGSGLR